MKFEVATYFLHLFYSGPLFQFNLFLKKIIIIGYSKGFNCARIKFEDQIKNFKKLTILIYNDL